MRIINSILFLTIVFQIVSNGQTELAGTINSTWSNNWNLNSYEGILLGRFLCYCCYFCVEIDSKNIFII